MKYNNKHKTLLFKILKEELKLTREDIILFLKISDSTYDKMLSQKVNREIPQKTRHFLETIFDTENWDEICKIISRDKNKIQKMLSCKRKYRENEYNKEFLDKNIALFHEILSNKKINQADEDFKYVIQLFKKDWFIDSLLTTMRVTKFHSTGDEEDLKEEDELLLGFFSAKSNPKEYQETYDSLINAGNKTKKKVKEKFKNKELFIFDDKKGIE